MPTGKKATTPRPRKKAITTPAIVETSGLPRSLNHMLQQIAAGKRRPLTLDGRDLVGDFWCDLINAARDAAKAGPRDRLEFSTWCASALPSLPADVREQLRQAMLEEAAVAGFAASLL